MVINNIRDLANHFGTSVSRLEHDIYEYTDCGAWITHSTDSVTVGSIVEGSEAEFAKAFVFPFSSDLFDEWLDELEMLTDEAWHEANPDAEEDDSYDRWEAVELCESYGWTACPDGGYVWDLEIEEE